MDNQYAQNLRYKLQKRVRRVNSASWQIYHDTIVHLWQFLSQEPWSSMLNVLYAKIPQGLEDARRITEEKQALTGETEIEAACLAAHVLKHCAASKDSTVESDIACYFPQAEGKYEALNAFFTEVYVQPLYEHLDEQLDDVVAVLSLITKYKQKAEWFQREALRNRWEGDTKRGEKHLGMHLYEYLHDQGLSFYIEPQSASGAVDMIASQSGDDRLLVDAKIFEPSRSKGKNYILQGFNQVYRYCQDYNESVGYLAIFKTTTDELKFTLEGDRQKIPYSTLNGKTIFFVVIDISDSPSASKAGKVTVHLT